MFDQLFKRFGYERRSVENPYQEGFYRPTHPAASGYVSPQAILSNSATAYRAIDLKATLLGSVPLDAFKRLDDGGRERLRDDPIARVLAQPNPLMTRFEFVELVSRSLDLHGNFYARQERDSDGSLTALWPLHPNLVQVERTTTGRVRYKISGEQPATLLDDEVLHVRNQSADGLVGQSPIQVARGALATVIAESGTARDIAETCLTPGGIYTVPGKMSDEAVTRFLDSLTERQRQRGRPIVLEDGVTYVGNAGLSSVDAQFLESRRQSAEDTSRLFGVPPASLGLSNTVSYGSAAQAHLDLVTATLNPLAARIEAAMERCLVPADSGVFFEFNLAGLLRADPNARWQSYRIGREVGALSPNDIRRMENLPPIQDGDEYTRPLNAAPLGTPAPNSTGDAS